MNRIGSAAPVVKSLLDLAPQTLSFEEINSMGEMLKREGLWMAALESCTRQGISVPPEIKCELVSAVAWEMNCRACLKQMGQSASKLGLHLLVFKGISLASSVYRPGQRSFGDIDIALASGSEEQLLSVLQEQGGQLLAGDFPEVVFNRVRFDIHAHPLGQLAESLELPQDPWSAKAVTLVSEIPSVLALAPEHEFLLSLFHGAKHCFSRANWVVDVAMLAYGCDAVVLAGAVRRYRAGRHLWLAQQCLKEWFDVDLPAPLQSAVSTPRRWQMASTWLKNRVVARRAPDFLGMLTPLWAIGSWAKRCRYLRSTLFPGSSGFKERLRHLISLTRSIPA